MAEPLNVAIVHLARAQARGEVRRVASWRTIFEAARVEVTDVALSPGHVPRIGGLRSLVTGDAVPESLTWSTGELLGRLCALAPDVVLVISTRAFDQRVASGPWTTILDYVDSLARSYADRAEVLGGLRGIGYAALARTHDRCERRLQRRAIRTVAAGWADAERLEAEWVPIVVDPFSPRATEPDHDVLFVGTLRYPPNIDALERLASLWPRVLGRRPQTSALIAGADPPPRVLDLATRNGWDVVANFRSLPEVAARTRVAVAPLARTAGIQIKVLDAASLGLPQVVTTPALAGLAPGFPLLSIDDDDRFAEQILRLLDDPAGAEVQAERLRIYVEEEYGVARWAEWAKQLLQG